MYVRLYLILNLLFFIIQSTSAQKSIKLVNKGKYNKAAQLSLQELQALKIQDAGNDLSLLMPHEITKRITPYHVLGLVNRVKGDFITAELNYKKADSVYSVFDDALRKVLTDKTWKITIRYGAAVEFMRKKQDKRYYFRQFEQAGILMKLGELESAKAILTKTNASMSIKYGAKASIGKAVYSGLGDYYTLKAQYDSSQYYYEKYILALRSDPNYFEETIKSLSDAYLGLAQSYLGAGNMETAVLASKKSYKYAKHRFVKSTDGKNYLGKIAASNQLAESFRQQNEYKKALKWSNKAFDLFNKQINVISPEKLPVLATRGQIFWALSDTVNANKSFRELIDVFFAYTQNNFSFLSEPERAYFYRNNKHFLDLAKGYYQYLYFQLGFHDEYIAKSLYEINLNNKGVLLNSSSKLLNIIYAKGDVTLINQYLDIRDLRERKTRFVQNGDVKQVAALDKEINQKEKSLRSSLAIESDKYINTDEVIDAIPDSTSLIDVLKCKVFSLVRVLSGRDSVMSLVENGDSRYLYFIFNKKSGMVLLQNEVSAQLLEGRFYRAYLNFARNNILNKDIYDAYFKPWKDHLSFDKLIISGDGVYNLLNPEILYDGSEFLINKYDFLSVVTVKDLLKASVTKPLLKDITLIGWPDYSTHLMRYESKPADLPGTETEINGIRKTIPSSVGQNIYMRKSANEITVKDIASTSILHFATHGFFDVSESKDPMYTSGLVLAISDTVRSQEDGYLTAYEASNLDLKKTFLVVLSACETGQGEFEEGEGVWGLQRAFQVAGVRYIVMSLFKVDDAVTALLMQQFYTNMIQGDDVIIAFRKAQLRVKSKFTKPVEWGAFVVKGF